MTIGFLSIVGQVVILRELSVAYFGVEIIYILAIGLWLLWTATGALLGRRGYVPSVSVIGWMLILAAVLVPLDIAFIRLLRPLFGGVRGTFLPFGLQLLALVVALLPVGVLLGLLFQWAGKSYVARG
ncbi:MAG TPA: hypothetical protein VM118_08055, partial [Acidobacteriota bacterium]|nr:hypothetical protein [Acidobacteriota bacterium]